MTWVSPDGSHIAIFVREGTESVLYVIPGADGSPRRLYATEYPGTSVPAWSPDGSELVFTDGRQMKIVTAGGGRPEVIAENVVEWENWILRWSPDGDRVAAFAYLEDELENVLMIVNRKTHQVTRVTPPEEDAYKEYLDWHPSGQYLSYMTYQGRYQDGSRIVNLATGETKTIAQMPDPMWDYFGTWGPDGNFYFTSGVRGSWVQNGLYVYKEDGSSNPVRVPPGKTINVPTWSRDGSVATWHETEHRRQLWMISDY
jgi:Tol biopolymer transport system component